MVDFDRVLDIFPNIFPRDPDSTLYKYTEAHEDEIADYERKLEEVRDSHFIDRASGEDLDRIGDMFGPLGERAGRSDQEYRIYLKTIVQAYKGAGTVPAIKKAVAAGLGVSESDVIIEEDFQNVRYLIKLKDWSDHKGTTIEELADLADASVATLDRTHYIIEADVASISDSVDIKPGLVVRDDLYAYDDVGIDPDKTTVGDDLYAYDDVGIDPDKQTVDDAMYAYDGVQTTENQSGKARWDSSNSSDANWDFFEWGTLEDLGTIDVGVEYLYSTDAVSVNPNKHTVNEKAMYAYDDVSYSTASVEWGTNWGSMNWAVEHN